MPKKVSVEELVKTIHQIVYMASDHAYKEKDDKKVGLKREMDYDIHDRKVIDGFNVRVIGNIMYIAYNTELTSKDVENANSLKSDVESIMNKIEKFIKSEYKSMTKSALSLKKVESLKIRIENVSSVRYNLNAVQTYEVGNIEDDSEEEKPTEKKLDEVCRGFLKERYGIKTN